MMNLLMFTLTLVPVVLGDLVILSTPDGIAHPVPCARTCSGTGKWKNWDDSGAFPGKVYKHVIIADCGFVSPPVVTVSTRSQRQRGDVCPSVSVMWNLTKLRFMVCSVENTTATEMSASQCEVHWAAFGYTC